VTDTFNFISEDPPTQIDIAELAAQALAEAMAWRQDPLNTPAPTDDMVKRAAAIVSAVADLGGRKFVVLVCGSEADAKRLAIACGKNGDHVGEALRVLDLLAEAEEAL
jgi:hypothetical protein